MSEPWQRELNDAIDIAFEMLGQDDALDEGLHNNPDQELTQHYLVNRLKWLLNIMDGQDDLREAQKLINSSFKKISEQRTKLYKALGAAQSWVDKGTSLRKEIDEVLEDVAQDKEPDSDKIL